MEIKLTAAEASYLLTLIDTEIESGVYYGNKAQYYARSKRIFQKIMDQIKPNGTED